MRDCNLKKGKSYIDHDYHMYRVQDLFDCISMNNYLILSKLQVNILSKTSQLYEFRNIFLLCQESQNRWEDVKGFQKLTLFFSEIAQCSVKI